MGKGKGVRRKGRNRNRKKRREKRRLMGKWECSRTARSLRQGAKSSLSELTPPPSFRFGGRKIGRERTSGETQRHVTCFRALYELQLETCVDYSISS